MEKKDNPIEPFTKRINDLMFNTLAGADLRPIQYWDDRETDKYKEAAGRIEYMAERLAEEFEATLMSFVVFYENRTQFEKIEKLADEHLSDFMETEYSNSLKNQFRLRSGRRD